MRAVIYARYSSDNQTEASIEGQLCECMEYAIYNDIQVMGNYIDRALSAKTDHRPEFQRMIKDRYKHAFDCIIVWKLDRFSRNRYDSAHYKALLRKNGVKVVSAKETIAEAEYVKTLLEDYETAKSAKLPFFGKNKDAEIIALRTKNEQLQREIQIRSQDQSDLFKQLQEANQVNSRKDTAYRIVVDMMSAYPDEFDALLHKSRANKNAPTAFRSYSNDKDEK